MVGTGRTCCHCQHLFASAVFWAKSGPLMVISSCWQLSNKSYSGESDEILRCCELSYTFESGHRSSKNREDAHPSSRNGKFTALWVHKYMSPICEQKILYVFKYTHDSLNSKLCIYGQRCRSHLLFTSTPDTSRAPDPSGKVWWKPSSSMGVASEVFNIANAVNCQ